MKKLLVACLFMGMLISCNQTEKKTYLDGSLGNPNTIKVIINKEQWQGRVGDTLRKFLAAPVDGLPREEPLFTLDQIPVDAFTGLVSKNRIYLNVELGKPSGISIDKNVTARPQTGITISGENEEALIEVIKANEEKIVKAFKDEELLAIQKRVLKSLKNTDSLRSNFGIKLNFPTIYRYTKRDKNFFWMRKDLKRGGNMNITVYEVPLETIDKDSFSLARIVRMRDSISGANITLGKGRFQTEKSYAPLLFETEIDGHFAWEMKGTWDIRDGRFMVGPFINYAIRDEKNNRYIVLEGFIFSPSLDQRDTMYELEAILKSAKIL